MKTTLFAVALVVALSLSAAAQHSKTPAMSQHRAGQATGDQEIKDFPSGVPPSLCNPCLFYGGDLDVNDFNAAGMSDENTLLIVGGATTWGSVIIPAGVTAKVEGILFNVQADAAFDPLTLAYDIHTGITEGSGGTSIASGSGPALVQATGRNFLGLNEYTLEVSLSSPITLTPGQYWFNVQPQCLNTLDGSCSVFRQFVSNTTMTHANNIHGSWQPGHQMFLNGAIFGISWGNWCDPDIGFNAAQCSALSFGLRGTE